MPESQSPENNEHSSMLPQIEQLLTEQTSVILQAVDERLSAQERRFNARLEKLEERFNRKIDRLTLHLTSS